MSDMINQHFIDLTINQQNIINIIKKQNKFDYDLIIIMIMLCLIIIMNMFNEKYNMFVNLIVVIIIIIKLYKMTCYLNDIKQTFRKSL
jgi:hypothetical protein